MDIFRICGIALISVFSALILKSYKNEYSLLIGIIGAVIISSIAIGIFIPIMDFISEISAETSFATYIITLQKALGICFISQMAGDICEDANMQKISQQLQTASKGLLLLLTLPLIKELLAFARDILEI